jgi:hypothetical protein
LIYLPANSLKDSGVKRLGQRVPLIFLARRWGGNLVYLKISSSLCCLDKPTLPVVGVEASGTTAIAGKEPTQEMPVRELGVYLRATQWEVHFQFYKTRTR